MESKKNPAEPQLRVFEGRSEYEISVGQVQIFLEGVMSPDAKRRTQVIKDSFAAGFLEDMIEGLKTSKIVCDIDKVNQATRTALRELVGTVTSETGRALIGLTVMQLSIKAIAPDQCVRLHKASSSQGSFSWVEGVSMRTLDKQYVTPTLRKHGIIRLNADGFMMTRSLAENYPYSTLYKAQLRGAKDQWISIVEALETGSTDPRASLLFFLSLLLNAANEFSVSADSLVLLCEEKLPRLKSRDEVQKLLSQHAESSAYSARLLEIAMHSLLQAAVESGALGDLTLSPLSQMRSANKKHGNVGDVELLKDRKIVESWDAKYGKEYLREEIEEAAEKIAGHDLIRRVGFVTDVEIQQTVELKRRLRELSVRLGVDFEIVRYSDWVEVMFKRCTRSTLLSEPELARSWIRSYVYTLAQRKRDVAPIDEPCTEWVRLLHSVLEKC